MNHDVGIRLKDVTLSYDLLYDRTQTLKEYIVNAVYRRKFVEKRKGRLDALKGINLEIRHGERLGIIGHNGAGKSTLLKAIAGIIKPTSGQLEVHGSMQPLIEIAAGFNPEFSGRENIYLNGYMLGFKREMIRAKEREIIEFADLAEFIDVPVKYYSSGMAVRLAFTIATSIDPEYLIFDEMLAAGDAAFFDKAKRRMDALVEQAKIVVLVSHSLEAIQSFATRTIVMERGEIIFDGKPNEAAEFYLSRVRKSGQNLDESIELSPLVMEIRKDKAYVSCDVRPRLDPISVRARFSVLDIAGRVLYETDHFIDVSKDAEQRVSIELSGIETILGQVKTKLTVDAEFAGVGVQQFSRESLVEFASANPINITGLWQVCTLSNLQEPANSLTDTSSDTIRS